MGQESGFARLKRSFLASAGDVVFGMEDGTVSIFGLVFGVAATTSDKATVLVAGASGAAAAAVSMMAGTYLDVETARDEARRAAKALETDVRKDPAVVLARVSARLEAEGIAKDRIAAVGRLLSDDPASLKGVAAAFEAPAPQDAQGPLTQALWMLVADFLAAAIPIVPFAVWPVHEARIVSAAVTLILLIGLGIGRARIGDRPIVATVLETVSIGVGAALAGVGIGLAIARAFGG
jgi:VIT1/CCC1 family predicted Fe2+/Mn2+ transporter